MALSKEELKPYFIKLIKARCSVTVKNGFLGTLLIQFKLAIDEDCKTVYFDGERIAFSPKFLDELEIDEVSHVLVHQMLHYLKGHFSKRADDKDTLNLACDVDNEATMYELNQYRYHGVGGYVIPYKLSNSRYKTSLSFDEIYEELSRDDIALYKSFDDHSRWCSASDMCKSQIYLKRAIALTPVTHTDIYPAFLKSFFDTEIDKSSLWDSLSSPLPVIEDIFEGKCATVPSDYDTLLATIYYMVEYAKKCKDNIHKIENAIKYAYGMPADFCVVLFANLCAIEKNYKDFLLKIPEFYKWMSKKGGNYVGII